MKKQFVVLGSAIFFVVIISMYLMLDQTKFSQELPGQAILTGEEINQLSNKIQILENDLTNNRKTIMQLRDAVRSLSRGDASFDLPAVPMNQNKGDQEVPVNADKSGHLKVADIRPDGAVAEVNEDECTFGNTPSGTDVDVQMLDVYNHLRFDNPNGGVWKQGFEVSYDVNQWKDDPLQIIVVPHSHNDPGWIKTLDKYYNDQTQHILNNAVNKLQEHEHMRLIWAEISFFSMWWDKIDRQKKDMVKRLIEQGKLEIVTGGWVMNDEANTHYFAMIDQMIEGHEWLDAFIGVKPKHGWAIDPFGMSPTMAYILQRMGFEAMVIQRVHYTVKKYLAQEKKLEFMWRQNWDHGSTTDMFCHLMPFYSYDVPHTCGPDPKVCCQFDFKRLPGGRISCPWKVPPVAITESNKESKARTLLDQYRKKATLYKSNVLLVPLGDDFRYDKTIEWDQQYKNYQKLFDYMNSREDWFVKARFGTLADYFGAVFERTRPPAANQPQGFPVLGGDFFTYTDRDDHYWSGYYTSRPFYKNMDRVLESQLRATEIAYSLATASARQSGANQFAEDELMRMMTYARRMLGLFQHHDGITGTAKDHVVVDYATRMLRSLNDLQKILMQSIHYLMTADKATYIPQTTFFDVDEERKSHDSMPEKKTLKLSQEAPSIVVFYNALAQYRRELVHLHVSSANVQVKDDDDNIIDSQANLIWTGKTETLQTEYELVFVVEIAPISIKKYLVKDMGTTLSETHHLSKVEMYHAGIDETENRGSFEVKRSRGEASDFSIENAFLTAKFSGTNGMLQSLTTKEDNKQTDVTIEFMTYGVTGGKSKSGAYLFLPDREAQKVNNIRPNMRIIKGPLLSEVHVHVPFAEHRVQLPNTQGVDSTSLSITNIVDIRTEKNKELVMRIRTGVQNKDRNFYTDLNAFQIQRRKTLDKLPLQANFYPMTSMAYLEDETSRFTVHTAQPLGAASLQTGWIEIVLDRRLMQDDNRGVQQGVTDNKRTPSYFRLQLERRSGSQTAAAAAANQQSSPPPTSYPSLLSHFTTLSLNHRLILHTALPEVSDATANLLPEFNGMAASLPCDVHLLNLRTRAQLDDSSMHAKREALLLLHRKGFDCSFPGTTLTCSTNEGKVPINDLFHQVEVRGVQMTSLSAMYDGKELTTEDTLELEPMEINTFRVKFH